MITTSKGMLLVLLAFVLEAFAVEFHVPSLRSQHTQAEVSHDGASKISTIYSAKDRVSATSANQGLSCEQLGPNVKFYIYELNSSLNSDLVQCYKDHAGVDIFDDFREEKGQNTADIWLHKLLEKHPSRTWNSSEAQLFYIPFYGFLSSFFSDLQADSAAGPEFNSKQPCRGKNHLNRVNDLASFLKDQPSFQAHPERHVMTVSFWSVSRNTSGNWYPQAPPAVVMADLYDALKQSTLLVYEKRFESMEQEDEYQNWQGPMVVIPYVAKKTLTNPEPAPATGRRTVDFFFEGSLTNDHGPLSRGLKARKSVVEAFQKLQGSMIVDTNKHYNGSSYEWGMTHSSFCLVPEGDTPTSARLFDSIAAKCVPLILSDEIALPFASQLSWSSFSVHPHAGVNESTPLALIDRSPSSVEDNVERHHELLDVGQEVLNLLASPNWKLDVFQARLNEVRSHFLYGTGSPYDIEEPGKLADCVLQEVLRVAR